MMIKPFPFFVLILPFLHFHLLHLLLHLLLLHPLQEMVLSCVTFVISLSLLMHSPLTSPIVWMFSLTMPPNHWNLLRSSPRLQSLKWLPLLQNLNHLLLNPNPLLPPHLCRARSAGICFCLTSCG